MQKLSNVRAVKITAAVMLVLALLFTALETVVMLFFYDLDVQLYSRNDAFPRAVEYALVAVTAVSLVITALSVGRKNYETTLPRLNAPTSFFAAVSAFLTFAYFIVALMQHMSVSTYPYNIQPGTTQANFFVLHIVFMIPAGVYMLIKALGRGEDKRTVTVLLGFTMIVWLAMGLITTYFNMTSPLNCPPRIFTMLSYIALMLTELYALGFVVGKNRPIPLMWLCGMSAILGGMSAVPALALTLLGKYPMSPETVSHAVRLTLSLYEALRLIGMIKHCELNHVPKPDPKKKKQNAENDKSTSKEG